LVPLQGNLPEKLSKGTYEGTNAADSCSLLLQKNLIEDLSRRMLQGTYPGDKTRGSSSGLLHGTALGGHPGNLSANTSKKTLQPTPPGVPTRESLK
jgi:hypothetical protein